MKLGMVSPLPPARTGVADYAAGLAGALRRRVRIDLLDGARGGYDSLLYQLGNNTLHLAAYRAALAEPGIAVLHDAVLHHLLLGSLDEAGYVEEFVYNYGEWRREQARDLWRSRSRSAADFRYFQYPMIRRVAERSRAVVVHNPAAQQMVLRAVPGARVVRIPHYFVPRALPGQARRTRDRLGIASDEVVIAAFGYLRESKRIGSILRALPAVKHCRFLLAGRFVSPELERALEPLLASSGVLRLGYLPEDEFWRIAEITDICVSLRSPSAGETSGITIKLMGIGKPVLVTDGEETRDFPELSVIRVDPGEGEVDMLAGYLRVLADCPEMRREIGGRAARHIAERHSLEEVARMYLELVSVAKRL